MELQGTHLSPPVVRPPDGLDPLCMHVACSGLPCASPVRPVICSSRPPCTHPHRQSTLDNIRAVWYPRVQSLKPDIPVVLACCKADLLEESQDGREIQQIREVGCGRHRYGCSSKGSRLTTANH